jgi:peroxiredoxin
VTHLVFVARWCGPCEAEVHALRREMSQLRRGDYRVVLVGAPQRQTASEFRDWARAIGFEGQLVFDEGGRLERDLGVGLIPWHVVIGSGGQILRSSDKRPDVDALRAWVAGATKE